MSWPQASLDPIREIRVLAEVLPGAALQEGLIEAPFDLVWSIATDFEQGIPSFDRMVAAARVLRRKENRLQIKARWPLGPYVRFNVELTPGLCIMHSRTIGYTVGMAAAQEGDSTRFAHMEAWWKLMTPLVRRFVSWDVAGLKRVARDRMREGGGPSNRRA